MCNILSHCVKMSIAKRPEKIGNPLDVTKISSEVHQLYLENKSQDFLDEIIKEMYKLYNEEKLKGKWDSSILDTLEQFLIKKRQNPENIIKYCLDNQFDPMVQFILAICYEHGKWVEMDEH